MNLKKETLCILSNPGDLIQVLAGVQKVSEYTKKCAKHPWDSSLKKECLQ